MGLWIAIFEMAVFRPKRQWKPKRRDKNVARRRKRKRWWKRNRSKIRMERRKRYRALRNNPIFKQWRKKCQREKTKRRLRMGSERPPLPEAWFIFRDDSEGPKTDLDLGYIVDYDPDSEELLVYDVEDKEEKVVGLEDFLRNSEFLEEADLDNFDLLMDQFYGDAVDDLDLIPDEETTPPDFNALQEAQRWVSETFLGSDWYRGCLVGGAEEGDAILLRVRVAPGQREQAKALLSPLPIDLEIVEEATPHPETVLAGWFRILAKKG